MRANLEINLGSVPVIGHEGAQWNRLHAEREDICELMLTNYPSSTTQSEAATVCCDDSTVTWHRELLERRLQKIDDALDRLMSGSYGVCSRCGEALDQIKLELDPAIAFCSVCWLREQGRIRSDSPTEVALESVEPFDTIVIRTANSIYRALMLDPKTGRVLAEGGSYLIEPKEAFLSGSTQSGKFELGSIVVGYRLEMWVDHKMMLTSPIVSVTVERHPAPESLAEISAAI